jgi:hypothetical protein
MATRTAGEIRTGDVLIEGIGGMGWRVDDVTRKGSMVELTINCEEAGMLICKPDPDQVKRFKATTRLRVAV